MLLFSWCWGTNLGLITNYTVKWNFIRIIVLHSIMLFSEFVCLPIDRLSICPSYHSIFFWNELGKFAKFAKSCQKSHFYTQF